MRLIFGGLVMVMLGVAGNVVAYEVTTVDVPVPYEVIAIQGDPEVEQFILGELADAPEMYEIVTDREFVLTVEIRALPSASSTALPDFSGIIIRENGEQGVEEVARLYATEAEWNIVVEPATGLPYRAGSFYGETLPAGTYRIEVSTPNNVGKYILAIGAREPESGYFASLGNVNETYRFYEVSRLRMFSSPYVHYPVGIFVLIGLIAGTWYWQSCRRTYA